MVKSDEGHPLWDPGFNPMMSIGRYFRLHEATASSTAARLGIRNEPNPTQLANIRWTATNLMDPTRENFGALRASSWLRVPELNDRIPGSSKTSAHRYGFAVDFRPVDRAVELSEIMEWLEESDLPFDQAILEYNRWIHLAGREGAPRKQLLMKFSGSRYLPFDLLDPRVG